MWLRAVLFTLAGQVSKFPPAFRVRRNAANIDRDLGFSRFPVQMCRCACAGVCEVMCVWTMRRSLQLLLGLLLLQQGRCFLEFVIEEKTVSKTFWCLGVPLPKQWNFPLYSVFWDFSSWFLFPTFLKPKGCFTLPAWPDFILQSDYLWSDCL